jgi:membrane protease YdiL (CAAX protease family)
VSERDGMAWPRGPHDDQEEEIIDADDSQSREIEEMLRSRAPHVSAPQLDEPEEPVIEEEEDEEEEYQPQAIYRGPRVDTPEFDPIFALMIVGAIAVGLLPVEANVRYVILWTLLGGVGLVGYMLGNSARLTDTSPEDLRAGLTIGFAIGAPFLIAMGGALSTVSERMFDVDNVPSEIMDTWVLMAVLFVIPAAESLFFRGVLQQVHNQFFTAGVASVWSMLVFYPHMDLGNAAGVALSIALFFTLLNFLYGWIRFRNGLAAAWGCQIVAGGFIWFLPRLLF